MVNTGLNFAIYSLCIRLGLSPPLSAGIAFICLIPIHLKSHSALVFRSKLDLGAIIRSVVALAISMSLNVGLVAFFWLHLLADPIPAQVLGIAPAVALNYMLLKHFVFSRTPVIESVRIIPKLQLVIAFVASCAVYLSVAAILLYTNPFLFSDDWRHYFHYFFQRDMWNSIFGRENAHLMVLPNVTFISNYLFLDGRMSNLALVSVALLSTAAILAAMPVWGSGRNRPRYALDSYCVLMTHAAMFLFLAAPTTLFWGMGVHNHFVVLGVVGASLFASGVAGSLGRWIPMFAFITFATTASVSFTTGAGAWLLGFPGALANRENFRTRTIVLVVGLIGFTATVLPLFDRDAMADSVTNVFAMALFSAAILGNMFGTIVPHLMVEDAFRFALVIGFIGFSVIAIAVFRVLTGRVEEEMRRRCTFFSLLSIFSFLVGLMIGHGRMGGEIGLHAALYPRFATWSLLGWVGIAGVVLAWVEEFGARLGKRWFVDSSVLVLCTCLLYGNVRIIDTSLRYSFSYHMDTLTQVAMNHTARPTERRLWRNREDVWLMVIDHLREHRRNIYNDAWPHVMDNDVSGIWDHIRQRCISRLEILPTQRDDEWKVRGWILPGRQDSAPVANVAFMNDAGYVVGFVKPVFGSAYGQDARYVKHMIWPARLVRALGARNISDLPGLSGHMIGRIRSEETDPDSIRSNLRFIAQARTGWVCKGRDAGEQLDTAR